MVSLDWTNRLSIGLSIILKTLRVVCFEKCINMNTIENCSLWKRSSIECGESRGHKETQLLVKCDDDISGHLKSCHMSLSDLREYELILQRAGFDDIPMAKLQTMRVCPRHRHGLGRYWRPLRSCQYPSHTAAASKIKGRDVISVELAKEIFHLYGINVPVGSRKQNICYYY